MEDISPLFAVQAEKALQNNNVQLAINLCERGLKFFPDYLMGYILLAEAYQKFGDILRRDAILEQVKSKFQASHYTQHIEKIIANVENPPIVESNFVETLPEKSEEILPEDVYTDEIISNDVITDEEENIDELARVIEGISVENTNEIINEISEEISETEEISDEKPGILAAETFSTSIEQFARDEEIHEPLENEQNLDSQPPEELIFNENAEVEYVDEQTAKQVNSNLLIASDLHLIPGIDFIPIRFNYYEVLEFYNNFISQNVSELQPTTELTLQAKLNDSINLEDIVQNFVPEHQVDEELIDEVEKTQQDYDEGIVPTATLAMIYEKQQKYQEALDIYEKLIIRTPEKADFYRSKIEEITNILFEM